MPTRLTIKVPDDYDLRRDVCSYGYFLLHPNNWTPSTRTFSRVFDLAGGPAAGQIQQPGAGDGPRPGEPLVVRTDRTLARADKAELERQITRMLRLDEDAAHVAAFHKVDSRWKKSGRARLFRSPTFFEDVLKTVSSCNVTWPGTVQMNRRLCEVCGAGGGFPSAAILAKKRPALLRARCRVGYRDARMVELAKLVARGGVKAEWFEDPTTPDDDVHDALLELPGVGPYAAANIMQLLGRYGRLPLDTESVRHGKSILGFEGSSAQIMKRVYEHFAPFGANAFRSYWFELWVFYEAKAGLAWTWERDSTGKVFTAAQLKKDNDKPAGRRPKDLPE